MLKDDLIVLTAYFNPLKYFTRLYNYKLFRTGLKKQRVPCITIECVLSDSSPELDPGPDVLLVRAKDSIWQKERLLNIALHSLPDKYSKIAWLDCDLLFPDFLWADKASDLLDKHPVIQLFEWVILLPKEGLESNNSREHLKSFGAALAEKQEINPVSFLSDRHGHTGYAWAARRELLECHGLYDAAVIGNGDHLMAHAMHGDWGISCLKVNAPTLKFLDHFYDWAFPFYQDIKRNIGYLPGEIYHFWHGDIRHRGYTKRNQGLVKFQFDPVLDLRINPENKTWEWASDKPELHDWISDHFKLRQEDG